jgi:hypothetical protein
VVLSKHRNNFTFRGVRTIENSALTVSVMWAVISSDLVETYNCLIIR